MADLDGITIDGVSYTLEDSTARSSISNLSAVDVGAIPAPSSPSTGAFLVWNGTAWVAQTLSTWSGGNY